MKAWISKMLVIVIMLVALIPSFAHAKSVNFSDVKDHWAKAQIEQAVAQGYVTGYPNGTFKPDAPVTRAQFITMLVRALGLDHGPEGSTWYTTYVKAAKEAAIYQGEADFAEWNMNKEISREHMAWLAVRSADESLVTVESSGISKEVTINRWPITAENNKITRTDEFLNEYYKGFLVHTSFAKGILTGFGGNVIGLDRTTTRAQAVTVIERILSLKAGKKLPTDKYAIAEAELLWLKTNTFTMAPHIFDDSTGISTKVNYKLENLVFKNSVVHTEVKRIILIDLDDQKDPYRKLLPATDKLGFRGENIGKVPQDAFAMYIEYETLYNKNPNQYWGFLSFNTDSYKSLNNQNGDVLTQPSRLNTKQPGFEQINMTQPSESGIGAGVTVWAIPNSSYTLAPNIGGSKNNKDRALDISFYVESVSGGETISNGIFYGTTTHYN